MKKLLSIIGVAALLATVNVNAGLLGWIERNPDAIAATNFVAAIAPSWAPGLKGANGQKEEFGVSGALLYPVNSDPNFQAFAGVRGDWLGGSFFTPSVNVQLGANLRFFGHFNATLFAVSG